MQGLTGLWKGHAATLLHRIPYSAVNFAVYENTRDRLTPILKSATKGGSFASEVRSCLLLILPCAFAGNMADRGVICPVHLSPDLNIVPTEDPLNAGFCILDMSC